MAHTLSEVGEFGLIARIRKLLEREGAKDPAVRTGIGDDTASFFPPAGCELLVTCDSIVEGRHFLPGRITPTDLGRRAMTLNISDIGAMGGLPLYALVSLGLKNGTLVGDVEALYRGFVAELNPFDASIIGGNLTKSEGGLFIDITLIGRVEEGRAVRRSTARPGDAILVTGYPGRAAAGLHTLLNAPAGVDPGDDPLVRAYNRPSHRAREGRAIALTGCATAMIDTSDGFLGDLGHICEESGVGAELLKERLPLDGDLKKRAALLGMEPYSLMLGDSDDYELIVTCRPEDVEKIGSAADGAGGAPLTRVGTITGEAGAMTLILADGTRESIRPSGWDHFRKRAS